MDKNAILTAYKFTILRKVTNKQGIEI